MLEAADLPSSAKHLSRSSAGTAPPRGAGEPSMRTRERLRLIQSHAGEAAESAARLCALGFAVDLAAKIGPPQLRELGERPPAAVVIDLGRAFAFGRDLALALRKRQSTRRVPLVLVGGEPAKVGKLRALLPDAVYAEWRGIAAALRAAIDSPPAAPVVPASVLAGYSGTPLPAKLGIKAGTRVALVAAPRDFRRTLGALPAGALVRHGRRGTLDLVLWFVRSRRELERGMAATARGLAGAALWIVWPKKATKPAAMAGSAHRAALAADLGEKEVRAAGLAAGLVDFKVCAIDSVWSGLKFTRRKPR